MHLRFVRSFVNLIWEILAKKKLSGSLKNMLMPFKIDDVGKTYSKPRFMTTTHFVYACVRNFSFWFHSIVHFSRFVFKWRKHEYFCCDFKFKFRILKLNVFECLQVDYVMFWWFKPIAFHLILHIQRFWLSQSVTFIVSKYSNWVILLLIFQLWGTWYFPPWF